MIPSNELVVISDDSAVMSTGQQEKTSRTAHKEQKCSACPEKRPQRIEIPDWLKEAPAPEKIPGLILQGYCTTLWAFYQILPSGSSYFQYGEMVYSSGITRGPMMTITTWRMT
jgi:hypothetical protein